jgi:tryptophanyl-tRNA synthetase
MSNENEFIVTPWEVKGKIDYERLIKDFGLQPLTNELLKRLEKNTGELHFFLKRKIFFAHRDLDWILDEYEKGNSFYLYTGRGPSGSTHIGHLIPWVFAKWLQEKFNAKLYFQITDDEKFLFKPELTLEEIKEFSYENILDIIAIGFDPNKTKIFMDTEYIKTLYKEAIKVAKKITFSTIKAVFGLNESSNIGEIFFTSLQSVPAFIESIKQGKNIPCLIPLAVDQDPHFRITRDVAPKLGFYKPAIIHSKFLPSLAGLDKMSSSAPQSCIFTIDKEEDVKKKIWNAFTGGRGNIEDQRKYGGNPDICTIYYYLYYFFEHDEKSLKEQYENCKSGRLLCGEHKIYLTKLIIDFLKNHQRNREKARNIIDKFILRD